MFGYVKPFKPELKIREFEAYKAVYCGLCSQLGKTFGPFSRLTLSYDFTFLSVLCLDVMELPLDASKRRCFVNPLKKRTCAGESEALSFSADVAAITLYYKLLDNIADSGFPGKLGWSLLLPPVLSAHKKARVKRPEADEIVRRSVSLQSELEQRGSSSLDEACEPTASAMSGLCGLISSDEKTRRVLSRFGYFLGRYVYICDAVDDLASDIKKGRYNPLVRRFNLSGGGRSLQDAAQYARQSLYMTIAEAEKAYALLPRGGLAPVLENTVTLGLRAGFDGILSKQNPVKGDV